MSLKKIREVIEETLTPSHLSIRRDAGGMTSIELVSPAFSEVDDRLTHLHNCLKKRGLSLPQQTLTNLLTPEEAPDQLLERRRSLPTWSDALRLEEGLDPEEPPNFGAKVAVFWGVKGGVGRTTALAHVARLLAKAGVRTVGLDLDLDAPSLVRTWSDDPEGDGSGGDRPGGDRPRFETLIDSARTAPAEDPVFASLVRRALHPAARKIAEGVELLGVDRVDEDFVHALLGRLTPRSLYRGKVPVLHRLITEIVRQTGAELVLIDARSGYCEESALAVLDLADYVALFASAAPSTYSALETAWVALERNHLVHQRPEQVHLVLGMQPSAKELRDSAEEEALAIAEAARGRVADALALPLDALLPNVEPITVDYDPRIVENDGNAIDGINGYHRLADRLRSHLRPPKTSRESGWFDDVVREAQLPKAQAEDELDSAVLTTLFTRPQALERLARPELPLVLGAKGTGKTYIRRICIEHPELVRAMFSRVLPEPHFINAFSLHGGPPPAPPVTGEMMEALDRQSRSRELPWSSIWSAIALIRLAKAMPDLLDWSALPAASAIARALRATGGQTGVDALLDLAATPLDLDDGWQQISRALVDSNRSAILLFDDLDVALGLTSEALDRRKALVIGLFDRLEKSWSGLDRIAVKILLREDLLDRVALEEAAKYRSRAVRLHWTEEDIWRLVIRVMAHASPEFSRKLETKEISLARLEEHGSEGWREPLEWLWGDRMGQSEADTRSLVWVKKRLSDGKEQRLFPRAAIWLLYAGLEKERELGSERAAILSPRALREAMPVVARHRLDELQSETLPGAWGDVLRLRGLDSYGNRADFLRHLQANGAKEPESVLTMLHDLGIVEFGERRNRTPTVRIVDLYAFAPMLEVKRVGRR